MMRIIEKSFIVITLFLYIGTISGCAAVTALRQPNKKNLEILQVGTSRDNVIMFLGSPVTTMNEKGALVDMYQFRQGYSGANKATRATLHIILDLFTLFIWEIIGWPAEVIIDGSEMTVKAYYDQKKTLTNFEIIGND